MGHDDAVSRPSVVTAVRSTALSVDEALAAVSHPRAGAVALFVGTVREHGEGPALDALGLPYTTLVYANGPGYVGDDGRPDLADVDTTGPDYLQEATVPLGSETHGGDDVGIWAIGPGSQAVRGSVEQNALYHFMLQSTPYLREAFCVNGGCNADGVPVELPRP